MKKGISTKLHFLHRFAFGKINFQLHEMYPSIDATIQFDGDDNDCQQLRNYFTNFDICTSYNNDVIYRKLDYIETSIALLILDQFWRCRKINGLNIRARAPHKCCILLCTNKEMEKCCTKQHSNVHRTLHTMHGALHVTQCCLYRPVHNKYWAYTSVFIHVCANFNSSSTCHLWAHFAVA